MNPSEAALYVRELQEYLYTIALYTGKLPLVVPDGHFDAQTTDSVRAFQVQNGLEPNGIVDLLTWQAIYTAYLAAVAANTPAIPVAVFRDTLRIGDTGDAVVVTTLLVNAAARRYPPITAVTVQSEYTDTLADAVEQLQRIFGLEPTGNTDKQTWEHLVRLYETLDVTV